MMNSLTSPELTFLFMGVVVSLGTALVWMAWELEQGSRQPAKVRRDRSRRRRRGQARPAAPDTKGARCGRTERACATLAEHAVCLEPRLHLRPAILGRVLAIARAV